MLAISASDITSAMVIIQVARYTQIIPAVPPLIKPNIAAWSTAIQVAMVTAAMPNMANDLKFRRSSWVRPRRCISNASSLVPVATPEASVWRSFSSKWVSVGFCWSS